MRAKALTDFGEIVPTSSEPLRIRAYFDLLVALGGSGNVANINGNSGAAAAHSYSKGSKCGDWMPSAASASSRVRTTFSSGRVGSPRS